VASLPITWFSSMGLVYLLWDSTIIIMDLKFKELRCPKCGDELEQGTVQVHDDVQMVKRCASCDFWMILVIPNDDYDYSIEKKLKKEVV
jgi:NAD-dependent SIR2 family protein deacetylase